MCILCERYGEGDIWYKNPKNYARRLYGLPKKGPSTAVGRLEEIQELELIKSVIDAKDVSMESFNQQLQGLQEMFMQNPIGQVLPLQDVLEIVDLIYPIAKIDCICRRLARATQENSKTYSCVGVGPGMYKCERWARKIQGRRRIHVATGSQRFLEIFNMGTQRKALTVVVSNTSQLTHCFGPCVFLNAIKEKCGEDVANLLTCKHIDLAAFEALYNNLNLSVDVRMETSIPNEGYCQFTALHKK